MEIAILRYDVGTVILETLPSGTVDIETYVKDRFGLKPSKYSYMVSDNLKLFDLRNENTCK